MKRQIGYCHLVEIRLPGIPYMEEDAHLLHDFPFGFFIFPVYVAVRVLPHTGNELAEGRPVPLAIGIIASDVRIFVPHPHATLPDPPTHLKPFFYHSTLSP